MRNWRRGLDERSCTAELRPATRRWQISFGFTLGGRCHVVHLYIQYQTWSIVKIRRCKFEVKQIPISWWNTIVWYHTIEKWIYNMKLFCGPGWTGFTSATISCQTFKMYWLLAINVLTSFLCQVLHDSQLTTSKVL